MTEIPCGEVAPGKYYPTGGTNTSQAWPPIYFLLVAIFMRIPMIWETDPLFAARLVTALFWSIGTSWLGFQIWKLTNSKQLGITFVMLSVALPTFFFYSSSVSPHSLNPLLIAVALFLSQKILAQFSNPENIQPSNFKKALSKSLRGPWIYLIIPAGILYSLAIPQSLSIIGLTVVYLIVSFWTSNINRHTKLVFSFAVSAVGAISAFLFIQVYLLWKWQVTARAIPVTAGVDPTGANQDPPDPEYISPLIRITSRWFSFWPDALHPGFPAGHDIDAVLKIWIFILAGLSITAIVIWSKRDWLGPLMLSLFITAPIFSIAYDYIFTTDVPGRYGLVFPLVGLISVANMKITKFPRIAITSLAVLTYFSVFILEPGYIGANMCHLNVSSQLIDCGH